MKSLILSLLSGVLVGLLFSAVGLPCPAPPHLSGVLGVFGVYFGGKLMHLLQLGSSPKEKSK